MELISKEVVKRIIDSERTRKQMLGMVECAVTFDSSTDCISREDAIRIASGYCHWSRVPEELAKLPSVKPKERTGKWIEDEEKKHIIEKTWHCSECGNTAWGSYEKTTYCCQCGARMTEVK